MKRFMIAFLLGLFLIGPASAEEFNLGTTLAFNVPSECVLKEEQNLLWPLQCFTETDKEVPVALWGWEPIVAAGIEYTQEHQREVAFDAKKNAKSVESMVKRMTEFCSGITKGQPFPKPTAEMRLVGNLWATVGYAIIDQSKDSDGSMVMKIQIWDNGFAREINALFVNIKNNRDLTEQILATIHRR